MKTMRKFTPLHHGAVLVVLALMLTACAREQEDVARATGALEAAPAAVDPAVEAPVVIDTSRVDRAEVALAARIATLTDPEARTVARLEQLSAAQADVMRDGELDRRSALATQAAIRARLIGTEEAARDGEAADVARRGRGEVLTPTRADLAAFELARTRIAARIGDRGAAPMELRTPTGVATASAPPTEEELRYAPAR